MDFKISINSDHCSLCTECDDWRSKPCKKFWLSSIPVKNKISVSFHTNEKTILSFTLGIKKRWDYNLYYTNTWTQGVTSFFLRKAAVLLRLLKRKPRQMLWKERNNRIFNNILFQGRRNFQPEKLKINSHENGRAQVLQWFHTKVHQA
jgi:hypothetical protein